MTTRVKYVSLYQANDALARFGAMELPPAVALALAPVMRAVTVALNDVDPIRLRLVEECALRDDDGQKVAGPPGPAGPTTAIDPEKLGDFNQQISELLGAEVDLPQLMATVFMHPRMPNFRPELLGLLGDILVDDVNQPDAVSNGARPHPERVGVTAPR